MKSDDDVICNNTIYVDDTTLYSMSKIVVFNPPYLPLQFRARLKKHKKHFRI